MYNHLAIYVYRDGERIGLLSSCESLQWMPSCTDAGEFKLTCAATEENRELLTRWNVLYNADTPNLAAIILAVEFDNDNFKMTVRGKFTLYLLAQRVCYGTRTVTDAAAGIVEICKTNLRDLPMAIPSAPFSAECNETVEWTTCYKAATQLADAGGVCISAKFNPDTAENELLLEQVTDRTDTTSENYVGYLSTNMRTLSGVKYTLDSSDFANVVVCAGEKPSEQDTFTRYICVVGATSTTGTDRHELYVDGSSVTHKHTVQKEDGSTEEQTYTEEEYEQALKNYAAAALLSHYSTMELTADAVEGNLSFGDDYNLGDRLPVKIEELGIVATARVASVKIIYESTGKKVQPVLDDFKIEGVTN